VVPTSWLLKVRLLEERPTEGTGEIFATNASPRPPAVGWKAFAVVGKSDEMVDPVM
jgi:hypothetical protein